MKIKNVSPLKAKKVKTEKVKNSLLDYTEVRKDKNIASYTINVRSGNFPDKIKALRIVKDLLN